MARQLGVWLFGNPIDTLMQTGGRIAFSYLPEWHKMAMKIGNQYRFAVLHARHWEPFAASAGLSPAQVKKELKRVAERLTPEARCATTLRRLAMSPAQGEAEADTPE
ncbi:MAG: hypothetical protein QUV35_13065 [Hydrogenophaga sp.]|uniref:hypothetical protein n=1 Tax=Hydrogenophaga sp. TaxID=1904254 RepID=UPI002620631D|nr:hypothetical protein [Hydrogenophaga sp.]MDM7943548.1 hypothetical protein [Hydrogenophaga sp.]